MQNNLLDRESNEFLTLIRERNLLANAIAEIEKALHNPMSGAIYSDFGWIVESVITNLKNKASK